MRLFSKIQFSLVSIEIFREILNQFYTLSWFRHTLFAKWKVSGKQYLAKKFAVQVSISWTFYAQLFRMKVFCTAFFQLQFGFVIFGRKNIGAKAACKRLMKLTTVSPTYFHLVCWILSNLSTISKMLCAKKNFSSRLWKKGWH